MPLAASRTDDYVTRFELEDELVSVEAALRDRPEFVGHLPSDEEGARSSLEIVVLTTVFSLNSREDPPRLLGPVLPTQTAEASLP